MRIESDSAKGASTSGFSPFVTGEKVARWRETANRRYGFVGGAPGAGFPGAGVGVEGAGTAGVVASGIGNGVTPVLSGAIPGAALSEAFLLFFDFALVALVALAFFGADLASALCSTTAVPPKRRVRASLAFSLFV